MKSEKENYTLINELNEIGLNNSKSVKISTYSPSTLKKQSQFKLGIIPSNFSANTYHSLIHNYTKLEFDAVSGKDLDVTYTIKKTKENTLSASSILFESIQTNLVQSAKLLEVHIYLPLAGEYFVKLNIRHKNDAELDQEQPYITFSYKFTVQDTHIYHLGGLNPSIFDSTKLHYDDRAQILEPLHTLLQYNRKVYFRVLVNASLFSHVGLLISGQREMQRFVRLQPSKKNQGESTMKLFEGHYIIKYFEENDQAQDIPHTLSIIVFDRDDHQLQDPRTVCQYQIASSIEQYRNEEYNTAVSPHSNLSMNDIYPFESQSVDNDYHLLSKGSIQKKHHIKKRKTRSKSERKPSKISIKHRIKRAISNLQIELPKSRYLSSDKHIIFRIKATHTSKFIVKYGKKCIKLSRQVQFFPTMSNSETRYEIFEGKILLHFNKKLKEPNVVWLKQYINIGKEKTQEIIVGKYYLIYDPPAPKENTQPPIMKRRKLIGIKGELEKVARGSGGTLPENNNDNREYHTLPSLNEHHRSFSNLPRTVYAIDDHKIHPSNKNSVEHLKNSYTLLKSPSALSTKYKLDTIKDTDSVKKDRILQTSYPTFYTKRVHVDTSTHYIDEMVSSLNIDPKHEDLEEVFNYLDNQMEPSYKKRLSITAPPGLIHSNLHFTPPLDQSLKHNINTSAYSRIIEQKERNDREQSLRSSLLKYRRLKPQTASSHKSNYSSNTRKTDFTDSKLVDPLQPSEDREHRVQSFVNRLKHVIKEKDIDPDNPPQKEHEKEPIRKKLISKKKNDSMLQRQKSPIHKHPTQLEREKLVEKEQFTVMYNFIGKKALNSKPKRNFNKTDITNRLHEIGKSSLATRLKQEKHDVMEKRKKHNPYYVGVYSINSNSVDENQFINPSIVDNEDVDDDYLDDILFNNVDNQSTISKSTPKRGPLAEAEVNQTSTPPVRQVIMKAALNYVLPSPVSNLKQIFEPNQIETLPDRLQPVNEYFQEETSTILSELTDPTENYYQTDKLASISSTQTSTNPLSTISNPITEDIVPPSPPKHQAIRVVTTNRVRKEKSFSPTSRLKMAFSNVETPMTPPSPEHNQSKLTQFGSNTDTTKEEKRVDTLSISENKKRKVSPRKSPRINEDPNKEKKSTYKRKKKNMTTHQKLEAAKIEANLREQKMLSKTLKAQQAKQKARKAKLEAKKDKKLKLKLRKLKAEQEKRSLAEKELMMKIAKEAERQQRERNVIATTKNIPIRYLNNTTTVPYLKEFCSLSSSDIRTALQFTGKQAIFLKIKGLKNTRTSNELFFEEMSGSIFSELAPNTELDDTVIYDVIIEDLRFIDVEKLTTEEKLAIKAQFREMDTDDSGEIDVEELRDYYYKIEHDRMLKQVDYLNALKRSYPKRTSEINLRIESAHHEMQSMISHHIDILLEADIDHDNSVDWNEFFLYEARRIAILKR